jgi:hypothetical protein
MNNKITDYSSWAKDDWMNIDFGDKRLNSRAVEIGTDFFRNPFVSPPKMLKSFKKIKAFYRFMDSDKVSHDILISNHIAGARKRLSDHHLILAIQDSSTVVFDREYPVDGAYDVGNIEGIVIHNTISVIPLKERGIIDGLLNQIVIKRKAKSQRTPADNESMVWKESILAVKKPENTTIVDVMDRGADALEIMHYSKELMHEYIIRAKQNRYIKNDKHRYLFDFARALPVLKEVKLEVNKSGEQKKRTATLGVAYSSVTLDTPKNNQRIKPLVCTIIHIKEINSPKNQEPIEWFILTSLPVDGIDDALQVMQYYSFRWIIEEYHKCLKTGFRLEKTQLRTTSRIENLLGFISVSAVKLLQMRDIVRHNPEADALDYVTKEDVEIIQEYYDLKKEYMTVDRFLRGIAQMGGFLNRKSDGNPGWQSIWEGWKYFMGLKEGINLWRKRCG